MHARQHVTVAGNVVSPPVMQLCPWGNQVAQFITLDASALAGIAASIDVEVPQADPQETRFGNLSPYLVLPGWRKVKFFRNMLRRAQIRRQVKFPRSIRTDGYRLQVCPCTFFGTPT